MSRKLTKRQIRKIETFFNNIGELGKRMGPIFFGDAKDSFTRGVSMLSALFWTWLEFMFLKFILTYIFGIAGYIMSDGDYGVSVMTMIQGADFIVALTTIYVLIVFLFRMKITYGKVIEK